MLVSPGQSQAFHELPGCLLRCCETSEASFTAEEVISTVLLVDRFDLCVETASVMTTNRTNTSQHLLQ
jgi:hypothetical protein